MDNQEFVAKKFFEIGKGPYDVTLDENTSELEKEAIRLLRAEWFLKQFHSEADDNDIEISKGMLSENWAEVDLSHTS